MVSLRKNEEEQKMQGIRMDVRSAFFTPQGSVAEGRGSKTVCPASGRKLPYYAESLSESTGYPD